MEPLPPALQTECSFEKITPRSVVEKKSGLQWLLFLFLIKDPLISVCVCVIELLIRSPQYCSEDLFLKVTDDDDDDKLRNLSFNCKNCGQGKSN